jgi:hypothetical protein
MRTTGKVSRIDRRDKDDAAAARIESSIKQGMAHQNVPTQQGRAASPAETGAGSPFAGAWIIITAGILALLLVLWLALR